MQNFRRLANGLILIAAASASLRAQTTPANGVENLRNHIVALAPTVRRDEALRVAMSAYATADQLRQEYRVVGPPLFHNFLVNSGIRKRGLCFEWAEDLLAHLDALRCSSVEFHWAEARAGTLREHNCVVVTAKGQPFRSGIVLDCWRHSGHLYCSSMDADHYPWMEDSAYAQLARGRRLPAAQTNKNTRTAIVHGSVSLKASGG